MAMNVLDFSVEFLRNVWVVRDGKKTQLNAIIMLLAIYKGIDRRKGIIEATRMNDGSFFSALRSLDENGWVVKLSDSVGRYYRVTREGEGVIAQLFRINRGKGERS